jgi:hypothetical protein
MTPALADQLIAALQQKPQTVAEVHAQAMAGGSGWSQPQVQLLLACDHGVVLAEKNGATLAMPATRSAEDELAEAIRAVVASFGGRPTAAVAIRQRLPGHLVTSDEQIKAIARSTSGLRVVGPGLIASV